MTEGDAGETSQPLARRINLPLLSCYGLGTILGAGIYVLVGKVAGSAGLLAPAAFIVAALVAAITALSYCQLVILYPKSAGEAYYVQQGFNIRALSTLVGYLVVFTGVVSSATLANGFLGYLESFIVMPKLLGLVLIFGLMSLIAIWGIAESLWMAAVVTGVEILGLAIVIYFCGDNLADLPGQWQAHLIPVSVGEMMAILSGAFLAFYAFIGFEDMVNVVEEVKDPRKTMPRAIIVAIVVSSLLYLLIAFVAIMGMDLAALTASKAPLKDLLATRSEQAASWVAVISLFAIINGVLIQLIMASRVLYGMADQGRAPKCFKQVYARTHTPWLATLAVSVLMFAFALWLPLASLAKSTSFIILIIFSLVNIALWRLRGRDVIADEDQLVAFPRLGALLCMGLLGFQVYSLF